MALKQIKNKIISTKKTGKVTKAMESVSAVKMRKSQERAHASRPYVESALRVLERVSASQEAKHHQLIMPSRGEKTLVLIVTSDKGLAGSVNSAVLKRVTTLVQERKREALAVIAIGKKAVEFSHRESLSVLADYTNVQDGVTLADVQTVTDQVLREYASGTYKEVLVVYQNFISTFEQSPVLRQILPLRSSELYAILEGVQIKGQPTRERSPASVAVAPYTVEPSAEEVLSTLLPQLVGVMVYHALLESKASEHSARMVAMKNATDKSKEMVKSLTIVYNKARQASITAEVSEITAGVEAMK